MSRRTASEDGLRCRSSVAVASQVVSFAVVLACLWTPWPSPAFETPRIDTAAASGPPITVTDDSGATVSLDRPARRIVTLAPSLTELVYKVGAGAAMIGTVDSSDHPSAAMAVPRIGDYQRLDIERIVALKPDLVLVWQHGNSRREVAQLEALGLKLFRLEPKRLNEVAFAIEKVGRLTGFDAMARAQADRLRAELAALRVTHAAQPSVRVFYQAWSRPLMTLGGDQLTNDVIELCGGRNVFADLSIPAPQVSTEAVVAARPEVILATRSSRRPPMAVGARAADGPSAGAPPVSLVRAPVLPPSPAVLATAATSAAATTPAASTTFARPAIPGGPATPASAADATAPLAWRAPRDPTFAAWTAFASIPAVARGWMFLLPADELVRAGPRIAQGARAVCEALDTVRAERR